ncbi:hypothetical protein ERO13_D13G000500v2 [Gossypium hirsutum]|nr:hypothetical protein ERO13_D13G000500v2 [Gossypium hirsutum]TYG75068.1 hypothetical protein ES288_D04G234400v1 [Gossypium darwinii]
MSLIQFRLTLSFSTSSMANLPSFSTEEFYWLASFFWGHHHLQTTWASLYLLLFSDLFDKDSSNDLIVNRSSIISNMILGQDIEIPFFIGLQFQIKRIRPRLVGSLFILGRVSMLLFGWFPQMRNRDSVLNALNGHSDHGRIEIKKILPKISFTLSLHMRSKLLLLSQRYTFRFGDMVQQMKIY